MELKTFVKDNKSKIIDNSRTFVYEVTSIFCNRKLKWSIDPELNVALLALNRAIESQDKIPGNYLGYAYVLIHSALIQYYIKLEDTPHFIFHDENKPFNEYLDNLSDFETYFDNKQRKIELSLLNKKLKKYSITLSKLKIKNIKLRTSLLNLSLQIYKNESLTNDILSSNKLNLKELTELTTLENRKIRKYKKYVLMLLILFSSDDLLYFKSFLNIKVGEIDA